MPQSLGKWEAGSTMTARNQPSMGHLSYAGALAVALVAAVAIIRLTAPSRDLALKPRPATPPKELVDREPHYVIDARPVSYEPSMAFNF